MSASRYDAIVIGAGANGLAAAAALAKKHRRVLVLERSDEIGGMSRTIEIAPGFRAPLGPDSGWMSTSTARGLGLSLPRLVQPATGIAVRHDTGFLALPTDMAAAARAIGPRSAKDAARWPAFVTKLHRLSDFLGAMYESPPPDVSTTSIADLASLIGLGRRFRALGRQDMHELLRVLPMSVRDLLDDELEDESLKAAVAAGAVRDTRQGPWSGATSFVLLHYLIGAPTGSVRSRAWWADGPDALVTSLAAQARKRRVEIRTAAPVTRIAVRDDAVSGVVLANGDELSCDRIVSTTDPAGTLLSLVDPVWLDPELLHAATNIKYRGCAALVFYAIDTLPTAPGLGNDEWSSVVSLSRSMRDIERSYDEVKYGRPSAAPHVEVSAPSLRWPSLAAKGHVVVARAQYVPSDLTDREGFGDVVTRVIDEAIPGFAQRVKHRRVMLPRDLASELAVTDGALTHGEILLDQILFMRPLPGLSRYATPISGLFLGGAGSNPGPGLPGAAGWLAARAALS